MVNRKEVEVPELEHDAMMLARFGHRVSANGRIERRIVAALVAHLAAHGFQPVKVWDGEEEITATDTKAVMELVFNLDEASVHFARPDGFSHAVLLVLGNGEDIVSDWNYTRGDTDGFSAAMDAFDVAEVL